jgi:hypothetical protein
MRKSAKGFKVFSEKTAVPTSCLLRTSIIRVKPISQLSASSLSFTPKTHTPNDPSQSILLRAGTTTLKCALYQTSAIGWPAVDGFCQNETKNLE